MVNHLGDAVQHRSKWCREETHNRSARQELFLAFRQDMHLGDRVQLQVPKSMICQIAC